VKKNQSIQVYFSVDEAAQLRLLAAEDGCSVSTLLRMLAKRHLPMVTTEREIHGPAPKFPSRLDVPVAKSHENT
jgi:hypothetical protein